METRTCEEFKKAPTEAVVPLNNSRNKTADLWIEFKTEKISKGELEVLLKRRCVENIDNWYFPRKLIASVGPDLQTIILKDLVAHNSTMVAWLNDIYNFAGAEAERLKIRAKIDSYSSVISQQLEGLRQLRRMKAAVTKGMAI